MYREEEKVPEALIEESLASLKEFQDKNREALAKLGSEYWTNLNWWNYSAKNLAGFNATMFGMVGAVVGAWSALISDMTFVVGMLCAFFSFLGVGGIILAGYGIAYRLTRRAALESSRNKTSYLLNQALARVQNDLKYYKALFGVEDPKNQFFPQSREPK